MSITADFSTRTLMIRRLLSKVFHVLRETNFLPRLAYSAKLSFKTDREIRSFHGKVKLRRHMSAKVVLQKVIKNILALSSMDPCNPSTQKHG